MNIKLDYKKIIPPRFHNVSYETDVPEAIKEKTTEQIRRRDGLYFWGEPGVGKTHIVCALVKNLIENGIDVKFFNTSDFLERLREEFDNKPDEEVGSLFREIMDFKGVLILDDIGAEKATEWTRERIYLIVNKRYEDMEPTIFTSNCDMEILSARMGDRVTSRIAGMTIRIKINGSDKRLIQNMNISNETN